MLAVMSTWLVLLVMAETGVWIISRWRRTIFLREIFGIGAENAMLRARRKIARKRDTDTDLNHAPDDGTFSA